MRGLKLLVTSLTGACILFGCSATKPSTATEPAVYMAVQTAATTQPAPDQPALPAGHPAIGKPSADADHLPAGHPSIPGMKQPAGALPAGHPALPQMQGGQLPAGHPSIDQLQAATTQPATYGTLTVRAVQKTAKGPAVVNDAVSVEFYNQDQMVKKIEAKLDDKGVAKIEQVPFGATYGQFVRVNHAGVEYTAQAGPVADKQNQAEVLVDVYESTDQQPAWQIKMRHMIIAPVDGGVQVMDVLAVENPTDKSWLGAADASGNRTTFTVLPAGATDVQLDGAFHECCVKVENEKVINTMALLPGVNKYQINYTIPIKDGKANLTATAPAVVKNFIVMVPDDGSKVTSEGLEGPSTVAMGGDSKTRFFRGQDIAAGKTVSISIGGLASAPVKKAATSTSGASNASELARLIAGAGGLVIFVVGGMVMFLKAPKNNRKAAKA